MIANFRIHCEVKSRGCGRHRVCRELGVVHFAVGSYGGLFEL